MIGVDPYPTFLRQLCRGLATGMRQLNGNWYVGPAVDGLKRPGDGSFRRVVPEPHIAVGDPSLWQNSGRLDGQQRCTRERKMTEVDDVPIGHAAIEYWHIGAMTIRLANSRVPTRNGVNSALMPTFPYSS